MRRILLTQGKFALVDDADFEWLSQWNWALGDNGRFYAQRKSKGRTIRMHRIVTNAKKGQVVDHVNHNGLDNRRRNLRLCTQSENLRNARKAENKSSKYKGVSWHKRDRKWTATVCKNHIKYFLGCFDVEEDAAHAYRQKAQELFGEYYYKQVI